MEMKKHCRVCHTEDGEAFYKTHKTICWTCYKAEKSAAGKAYHAAVKEQEATRQEEQRRREREIYQRAHTCRDCGAPCEESISHAPRCVSCQNKHEAARPHAFCEDCKQAFAVDERGYLCVPYFEVHSTICTRCDKPLSIEYTDDGRVNFSCLGHTSGSGPELYGRSPKYCPTCRGERRKNNRQAYPLCPMCGTPTRVWDFLKTYQGYHLDIIKVCCTACIPQFEAQPERERLAQLRSAMVKTYGETAVIYALQYDESFHCHHIGRTKHLTRRMAEYRRRWDRPIQAYHVLEEIPFGPLSMERESRWILHALKHGWPIDNFDMFTSERGHTDKEVRSKELELKARLWREVAKIEPLTAPFEVIAPIIREGFYNGRDIHIVHWFLEHT